MLGSRENFDNTSSTGDSDTRIAIETLRFFQENDEEAFETFREDLKGSKVWNEFMREYGDQ